MDKTTQIGELVQPVRDDLLSGAAEVALRAITIFQTVMQDATDPDELKKLLIVTSEALIDAQPAMAPVFHLCNSILLSIRSANTVEEIKNRCDESLTNFEKQLCDSAEVIADRVFELIPPGEVVFAYSFSSTVVSCLLNARAKGRFFRVACTEARPALEGNKLASRLAKGGIEVMHTFDNAMGLLLPTCAVAFMGADCIGRPGVVNKAGSWLLAIACKELGIPLYAVAGTEKFVTDERLFEFERHERPAEEVWGEFPKGVRVLNRHFELIPFSHISGVVTEQGILKGEDVDSYVSKLEVHESLQLEPAGI